jgi:hypothetical protein
MAPHPGEAAALFDLEQSDDRVSISLALPGEAGLVIGSCKVFSDVEAFIRKA